MREGLIKRKERSDKKKDVKPTVSIKLYDCISDLSYITKKPMKDIIEFICMEGINRKYIIDHLSNDFKRDYIFENTRYIGNQELNHPRYIIRKEKFSRRVSTRFTKGFYERIVLLSYALDHTPSSATGLLLEASVKDINIIVKVVKYYTSGLDENRQKALRGVIRFVKKDNPYIEPLGFKDIAVYLFEWLKKN